MNKGYLSSKLFTQIVSSVVLATFVWSSATPAFSSIPAVTTYPSFSVVPEALAPSAPTAEEAQAAIDEIAEHQTREEQLQKDWALLDAQRVASKVDDYTSFYTEILRRAGSDKLLDTAFVLAALDPQSLSEATIFRSFSVPGDRFPGLKLRTENLRKKLSVHYGTEEQRTKARREISQLLLLNAFGLSFLEQKRDQAAAGFEAAKKRKDREAEDRFKDEYVQAVFGINEVLGVHPAMMLLLLPLRGPERVSPKVNPQLYFGFAQENKSLYRVLVQKRAQGFPAQVLMQMAEDTLVSWLPAWNELVRYQRTQVELQSFRSLFKHDTLRIAALTSVAETGLEESLKAFDEKKAVDWGYQERTSTEQNASAEGLKDALEMAGFFVSLPVGWSVIGANVLDETMLMKSKQISVMAGGFVGWNQYHTIQMVVSQSLWRPLAAGALHGIFAHVNRLALSKFLNRVGSSEVPLLTRFQSAKTSLAALLNAEAGVALRGMGRAGTRFVQTHPREMFEAVANLVAGTGVMVVSSMIAREKDLGELVQDSNFVRDMTAELLCNLLLGFYAAGRRSYVEAAFTLGGVAALTSMVGQWYGTGTVNWDRLCFDYAFIISISYWKSKLFFSPLGGKLEDGVHRFFKSRLAQAASVATSPTLIKGLDLGLGAATFTGVQVGSNFVGTPLYLEISKNLIEVKDLDLVLDEYAKELKSPAY